MRTRIEITAPGYMASALDSQTAISRIRGIRTSKDAPAVSEKTIGQITSWLEGALSSGRLKAKAFPIGSSSLTVSVVASPEKPKPYPRPEK